LHLENRLFRPIEEIVEDAEDVEDADVDVEEETRRNGSL
jgi:nitrogen fixation/metabolism regulation signal transduction histidine kinase